MFILSTGIMFLADVMVERKMRCHSQNESVWDWCGAVLFGHMAAKPLLLPEGISVAEQFQFKEHVKYSPYAS